MSDDLDMMHEALEGVRVVRLCRRALLHEKGPCSLCGTWICPHWRYDLPRATARFRVR